MLTACGIETMSGNDTTHNIIIVATVLTACGIETSTTPVPRADVVLAVATVLTACGIETGGLNDLR